jgi:hypothetical protein
VSFTETNLASAHKHCAAHRAEVQASELCGCFFCRAIFPPVAISDWIEEAGGELAKAQDPWTAICPMCKFDSVIGDASGFPASDSDFLEAMNRKYF